ncbi:MAG: MarP family serine protease [Actinomycetota bacterium]|nr:MarP family serine protease [Actinomycetota bacterium]MDQ3681197.1 MarP family serine protease [Actinomycetota bacterium]
MNLLDALILVAGGVAALGAYRLGFLARALSWLGLAVGIFLGALFLPTAVSLFEGSSVTKLMIAAGVLLGGAFLGQGLGLLAGASVRRFVPHGPLRTLDSAVGAVVGVIGVLTAVWLLLPSLAVVPGAPANLTHNSAIARAIDARLPPPPNTLQSLRRLVGETGFPRVFETLRPAPRTGPPPAASGLSTAVLARVSASTVKVTGIACRRIQDGSGFAAGPDTIVTNAHVVAGQGSGRTQVIRPDGRRLGASVIAFDADRDLAVLRVPGLGQQPLGLGTGSVGSQGAVLGHPGGQADLRVAPAAVRQRVVAVGRDLYDERSTRREVFVLAASLRSGDSGGALVNTAGTVMGVAFAIAPDRPGTAYAVTDQELRAVLSRPRGNPVSTGPCLGN